MRYADITLQDESGRNLWTGSLRQFARDNRMDHTEVAGIIRQLREGEPPRPAFIGGGAQPIFMLHLLEPGANHERTDSTSYPAA